MKQAGKIIGAKSSHGLFNLAIVLPVVGIVTSVSFALVLLHKMTELSRQSDSFPIHIHDSDWPLTGLCAMRQDHVLFSPDSRR